MRLLDKNAIHDLLDSDDPDSLFIEPLLEDEQVGNVTIDLRLGYDFLVSILTRRPAIRLIESEESHRPIRTFFQETRRELGEKFVVYPNQVVLTTSLEYLALPTNTYADLLSRSSYNRLGISLNTMVQPGFRGCIGLELSNHGNVPVELVVGSRICQIRLFELDTENHYLKEGAPRKYYGHVRPVVSSVDTDSELAKLTNIQSDFF